MSYKASGTFLLAITTGVLLSGCVALEGVPQGLDISTTSGTKTGLPTNDLSKNMVVASNLTQVYKGARDKNLRYAFWSNAALVPIAAGGAGAAVGQASKQAIASIGIAAGSLIGLNTFVNARANAKVYQSGITAINCLTVNLSAYTSPNSGPPNVIDTQNALNKAIDEDDNATSLLNSLKSTPKAHALTAGQSADFVAAQTALQRAISDAQTQIKAQETQQQLYSQIGIFSANAIIQIDGVIMAKISQSDVNYTTLSNSLASGGASSQAGTAAPPHGAPMHDLIVQKQSGAGTTLGPEQEIAAMKAATAALAGLTTSLTQNLAAFTLSSQESAVEACIKAI